MVCKRVKDYLNSEGVDFMEKSVDDEGIIAELVGLTGRSEVPVVEVDGDYSIGYDLDKIKRLVGVSTRPV